MVTKLLQLLTQYNFSVSDFSTIVSKMHAVEVKRNKILVEQNSLCNKIYFINKGLIRAFVVNEDGKRKTLWIYSEGQFVTDYSAFTKNQPSRFAIEVLQDSQLFYINYDDLQFLYRSIHEFNRFGRMIIEQSFINLLDEMMMLQTVALPINRYKNFMQRHKEIANFIPQNMIADMINVTPVHLSRIKSELKKSYA